MRRRLNARGMSLVEVLVVLGLGATLLGAVVVGMQRVAKGAVNEQRLALAQNRAYSSVTGLEKELKGKPLAAVLQGSGDKLASLVGVDGEGALVLANGYSSRSVTVEGNLGLAPGDMVFLVNGAGQALLAGVVGVSNSAGGSTIALSCDNPVRWTENTRVYKAEVLTLDARSGGLKVTLNGGTLIPVEGVNAFTVSYVYASPASGEEVSGSFLGMRAGEKRLVAVGLSASGDAQDVRRLTSRLPVSPLHVPVEAVLPCGGTPPPPGKGTVTVVVSPEPPGGGDLTLGATNYTQVFRSTKTFTDVPEGSFQVQAREVWTDELTAWAPSPRSAGGYIYAFLPVTVRISYAIVPGQITFSASGFPADGSATVSAGPYGATLGGGSSQSVSAQPGVYGTSASAEVSVSRSQGSVSWTEVYTLRSVSPAQATVRSYGTVSVAATYSGPLPGTLCYDADCRQAAPGRYTAPGDSVVRTWTNTYSQSCPSGQTGSITVTERWRTVKYLSLIHI